MSDLKKTIIKLSGGSVLSPQEATDAFEVIMSGEASDVQIGAFLMGLRQRGETIDEIAAAARVMREKSVKVEAPEGAIDTCGTGGDASGTYNISTAAAFVLAACGVPVAKHGNRALSSKSGSSQVLEALGVNIMVDAPVVERAIREAGLGFMFAPKHHGAMKHVGPARTELGFRTIFNLLGPLSNPAGTKHQLVGVFSEHWVRPMAFVLQELGCERAWVVHGRDGLDELTTTADSAVAELKDGEVMTMTVTPEDAGLPRARPDELKGGDAEENAKALLALLEGAYGPYRDIVVLNAAAALIVAGKTDTLEEGAAIAQMAINSGGAKDVLDRLVAVTNG